MQVRDNFILLGMVMLFLIACSSGGDGGGGSKNDVATDSSVAAIRSIDLRLESELDGAPTNTSEILLDVEWSRADENASEWFLAIQADDREVARVRISGSERRGSEAIEIDTSMWEDGVFEFEAVAEIVSNEASEPNVSNAIDVVLDKTPPNLSISWPPQNNFGTDLIEVPIEGVAIDDFGIDVVRIQSIANTMEVSESEFSVPVPIDPITTERGDEKETLYTVIAIDQAGNQVQENIRFLHTMNSTFIPVSASSTVRVGSSQRSTKQGFVGFESGVEREEIHQIVEAAGGRVVGFYETINTALVLFLECESVHELVGILGELETRPEIRLVSTTGSFPTNQQRRDNASLSEGELAAYHDIRSDEAIQFLDDNVFGDPAFVSIAIIDSGLDLQAGRNGELTDIEFIDAVRPGNRAFDAVHHGTQVAGIIAGANNGHGNHGIATSAVDFGDFQVNLFGVASMEDPTELDENAALFAMNESVAQGFDIVNLSFAREAPNVVSPDTEGVYDLIFEASPETLWVVSAGNGNAEVEEQGDSIGDDIGCEDSLPAALSCRHPNVLSVAAHNPRNDAISSFSNYGRGVQISAPGEFVFTATRPGLYGFFDGTSAAAPLVSGTAALVAAVSDLRGAELRDHLVETARPLPGSPVPGADARAAVALATSDRSIYEVTGEGEGCISEVVPDGQWPTPPGLSGFQFDLAPAGDRHIDRIQAGVSQNAVISCFADKNSTRDDRFVWSVSGLALPPGTYFGSASGSSDGGSDRASLAQADGVYVITGFSMEYHEEDHHIDELGVVFRNYTDGSGMNAVVYFNDQNNDDGFRWRVDYAIVPRNAVDDIGAESSRTAATGSSTAFLGSHGLYVLSGFWADYTDGDHHIDEIAFNLNASAQARIAFNDKNDDDKFEWSFEWVRLQ